MRSLLGKYYYSDGTILDHYDETKTLHRKEAPAIEYADGTKIWYLYNKLHREGAPAVEYAGGTKIWYLNGKRHREDGPAMEHSSGTKYWYFNGSLHRQDGPAVECADGTKGWYLEDKPYTEEEYYQELNQINNLPNILKLVDPRAWVRAKYQGEVHEG